MPKAIWNGVVLAENDKTVIVDGNHYFPPESINRDYFRPGENHTVCPWKGVASYYDLEVDGQINRGAAWSYPEPKAAARNIKEALWEFPWETSIPRRGGRPSAPTNGGLAWKSPKNHQGLRRLLAGRANRSSGRKRAFRSARAVLEVTAW